MPLALGYTATRPALPCRASTLRYRLHTARVSRVECRFCPSPHALASPLTAGATGHAFLLTAIFGSHRSPTTRLSPRALFPHRSLVMVPVLPRCSLVTICHCFLVVSAFVASCIWLSFFCCTTGALISIRLRLTAYVETSHAGASLDVTPTRAFVARATRSENSTHHNTRHYWITAGLLDSF